MAAARAGRLALALCLGATAQEAAAQEGPPKPVGGVGAVPAIAGSASFEPKDGILDVELSEYAGYAGLVAANGGLEPSAESHFARRPGPG